MKLLLATALVGVTLSQNLIGEEVYNPTPF